MDALATAILLAVVVKSVLDYIAEPLRSKFPQLDLWWFNWLALVVGGIAAWFAEINLFSVYFANPTLGRVLSAFVVGGGAKLINQVFSNAGAALPGIRMPYGLTTTETPRVNSPRPRGW